MLTNGVSISWVSSHRRSKEIAKVAGVVPHFVRESTKFLPARYLRQHQKTRQILSATAPEVIVVMQPPPFALASVLSYASKNGAVVIGDLHSGVFFDKKWSWASRWVLRTLRKHGGALVPNADLAKICERAQVDVFVSHGWIEPLELAEPKLPEGLRVEGDFVLVPFTYAADEPVDEVFEAAKRTPHVCWVLTGNPPEVTRRKAPANVIFPGYVPSEEYAALQLNASAILALTTRKSTMQSAGYEAVASATPVITVDEPVLVDYFGTAAIYTGLSGEEIAAAVGRALSHNEEWRQRMVALRLAVMEFQPQTAAEIQAWARARVAGRTVGRIADE